MVLNVDENKLQIQKLLNVNNDPGMLLCSDPNDINEEKLSENSDNYLLGLARDNIQLLVQDIWQLPTERIDECIVAKLPTPNYILPRLRKIPEPKPLTKWEKFAKEKGIQKKKRDKKVYDKELDKWVPTYGYKRADADHQKDWLIEVPKNVDPNTDMFQKKIDLKSEKVAKNEIQRMKNVARIMKTKTPRVGYSGLEISSSNKLLVASTVAKASTASIGKFQEKLPKEKEARGLGVPELIPGKKRKNIDISKDSEKAENLMLFDKMLSKKAKYDINKAVSLNKRENQSQENEEQNTRKSKKKNKTASSKKGKKPKPKKVQKVSARKQPTGRKRR